MIVDVAVTFAFFLCLLFVAAMCLHGKKSREEIEQKMFNKFRKKHMVTVPPERKGAIRRREQERLKQSLRRKNTQRNNNNKQAEREKKRICSACGHVASIEETDLTVPLNEREMNSVDNNNEGEEPTKSVPSPLKEQADITRDSVTCDNLKVVDTSGYMCMEGQPQIHVQDSDVKVAKKTNTDRSTNIMNARAHCNSLCPSQISGDSHFLTTRPSLATYISFTHSLNAYFHTTSNLDDFESFDSFDATEGCNMSTVFSDSTSDPTYVVPNCGPKIRVLKSSIESNKRREAYKSSREINTRTNVDRVVSHGDYSSLVPGKNDSLENAYGKLDSNPVHNSTCKTHPVSEANTSPDVEKVASHGDYSGLVSRQAGSLENPYECLATDPSQHSTHRNQPPLREITSKQYAGVVPHSDYSDLVPGQDSSLANPNERLASDPSQHSAHRNGPSFSSSMDNTYESLQTSNVYESVDSFDAFTTCGTAELEENRKASDLMRTQSNDTYEAVDMAHTSNMPPTAISARHSHIEEEEEVRYSPFPTRRKCNDVLPSPPRFTFDKVPAASLSESSKVKLAPKISLFTIPQISICDETEKLTVAGEPLDTANKSDLPLSAQLTGEKYPSLGRGKYHKLPVFPHKKFAPPNYRPFHCKDNASKRRPSCSSRSFSGRPSLPSVAETFEEDLQDHIQENSFCISTPMDRRHFDTSVFQGPYLESAI